MQRLSKSGHASYSVVLATFMLQPIRPNLEGIKLILEKARKRGSNGATYFDLMLKVLVVERFSKNEVFPAFKNLFNRRQLANCRNTILNKEGPRFSWECLCSKLMPQGLKYQLSCPSDRVCEEVRRICNTNSPLPGPYEDYPTTSFCLSCHLDLELACFLEHFRFLDLDFL